MREDCPSVFRYRPMLRHQIRDVLQFYYPRCLDRYYGGYQLNLDEREGYIYDGHRSHIVGVCRMVYNFCAGVRIGGPDWCRSAAARGFSFLFDAHYNANNDGFDWILRGTDTEDDTRYCYGYAFCLLACAAATEIGLPHARDRLNQVAALLNERFFESEYQLHRTEANSNWDFTDYRGQNANMHACEAYLAAFDATGTAEYLERAYVIADGLVRDPPVKSGLVPEHYDEHWDPTLDYNRNKPYHQFRPPGFQPGHSVEWAKLLVLLGDRHSEKWPRRRAHELFEAAFELGWDEEYGGFYYTVEADGTPIVPEKYGWEVAEGIGAAALLSQNDDSYLKEYDQLWEYSRTRLINQKYGTWYEKVTRDGNHIDPTNSGPRVEPGYHPVANAVLAIDAFSADRASMV